MKSGMCVHTPHRIRIGTTILYTIPNPNEFCSRGACKSKTINTPDCCNFNVFFFLVRFFAFNNTYSHNYRVRSLYIYNTFTQTRTHIPFILKIHTKILLSLVVVIHIHCCAKRGTHILKTIYIIHILRSLYLLDNTWWLKRFFMQYCSVINQ